MLARMDDAEIPLAYHTIVGGCGSRKEGHSRGSEQRPFSNDIKKESRCAGSPDRVDHILLRKYYKWSVSLNLCFGSSVFAEAPVQLRIAESILIEFSPFIRRTLR
jgi:hypothetical protein